VLASSGVERGFRWGVMDSVLAASGRSWVHRWCNS
jgi:hypothetical protein